MSPKTVEKNEEVRQQSKSNIMNAAFTLMARDGYESTSIAQIAKVAGVSKGLLYNYFSSKQELLMALVHGALEEWERIEEKLHSDNPSEKLRNIIDWFFMEISEHSEQWKMITALTFKIEKFEFIHDIALQKMENFVQLLEDILSKLNIENPSNEAQLLGALFDGIGMQYLILGKDLPIEEMKKYLIDKYCKPI